jgi:hypothetical protein
MTVVRHIGKVAAGLSVWSWCPAGPVALGALVFRAVPVAGIACWVFSSGARADRVSRVLLVW